VSTIALRRPVPSRRRTRRGLAFLLAFSAVAIGLGAARALTTAYVPVLLDRIADRPGLIGAVMLVNAAAGFAIPLVTGLWSDRSGRRSPFIAGGAAIAMGGLVAIALGTTSSYFALGLAAATVYIGLNAATTAHRTLVADRFADGERPKATGAQEVAMLVGALVGTVAGGALIDTAPELLFGAVAVVVALLAGPTLALPLVREDRRDGERQGDTAAVPAAGEGQIRLLLQAARTPGAREVLLAQVLWVFAYAALTPFMVLYAEDVLGIGAAAAGLLLAGFGLITGAGMLLAGRLASRRIGPALALGAALLGGGLLAATPASDVAAAALPFAAAALGAGLVTALGFPYFARFIPGGAAGTYSGVFFSVRAISTTLALPAAGGLVAATGSYRSLLLQGAAALVALVPLARARRHDTTGEAPVSRPLVRRVAAVIPVFRSSRLEQVVLATLPHVDAVVLVDDGAPTPIAARAEALAAADPRVTLLRRAVNGGKGAALADAYAALLARSDPPDAVLSLDSDGQHPPERIPAFLAAVRDADMVIGDRRGRRAGGMPLLRRAANAATSTALSVVTRRRIRDSQNGMRLVRTDILRAVPLEPGGFEAETRHLKALIRRGADVGWVALPTIYAGEPSSFRPLRDSLRIGRELLRPRAVAPAAPARVATLLRGPGALLGVLRDRWPRLALGVLALVAAGLTLPTW
jgi:predicted MFS family arabinose efflux permease